LTTKNTNKIQRCRDEAYALVYFLVEDVDDVDVDDVDDDVEDVVEEVAAAASFTASVIFFIF